MPFHQTELAKLAEESMKAARGSFSQEGDTDPNSLLSIFSNTKTKVKTAIDTTKALNQVHKTFRSTFGPGYVVPGEAGAAPTPNVLEMYLSELDQRNQLAAWRRSAYEKWQRETAEALDKYDAEAQTQAWRREWDRAAAAGPDTSDPELGARSG